MFRLGALLLLVVAACGDGATAGDASVPPDAAVPRDLSPTTYPGNATNDPSCPASIRDDQLVGKIDCTTAPNVHCGYSFFSCSCLAADNKLYCGAA